MICTTWKSLQQYRSCTSLLRASLAGQSRSAMQGLVLPFSRCRLLRLTGFEFVNVAPLRALTKLEQLGLSWGPYETFDASPMLRLQQFSYEFYGCADQMRQMAIKLPDSLVELRVSTLGVWRRTAHGAEEMQREVSSQCIHREINIQYISDLQSLSQQHNCGDSKVESQGLA